MINLVIQQDAGNEPLAFTPRKLVIAGWTGRDTAVLEAHIEELAALGVGEGRVVHRKDPDGTLSGRRRPSWPPIFATAC